MYGRFRPRTGDRFTMRSQPPSSPPHQASLVRTRVSQGEGQAVEVEGVYIISVAARILEMHPQTLRKYERLGLISPGRTVGMLRLYSRDDIRKLRLIRHLMYNLGFNLAGVEFTLSLVDNLLHMRERLAMATEGSPLQTAVEHELALLFHSLNLPLEE